MRQEQARAQQRHHRQPEGQPHAGTQAPDAREQEPDQEQVGARERRQERRDQAPVRVAVACVVDEVLGQIREAAAVLEPELVGEPASGPRARAPPRQRDRVDVDDAERGHPAGGRDDGGVDAAALPLPQIEAAAEQVAGDREQVLAHAQDDAAMGRRPSEQVLGQEPVHDHAGPVGQRQPVEEERPEASRAVPDEDDREPQRQQRLLPGGDDLERGAPQALLPEQRHDQVVECQPHHERVQEPDGVDPPGQPDDPGGRPHSGPTATSVRPRLTIRTG